MLRTIRALTDIQKEYFPPSESEGGWRKNTDSAFIRSPGIDPQKLEECGKWNIDNNRGGKEMTSGPMPGQIITDPQHPDKMAYNMDKDNDGIPDPFFLCGARRS